MSITSKKHSNAPAGSDRRPQRVPALALVGVLCASSLAACATHNTAEGIGYRQARFEEREAERRYEECVAEAVELDREARANASIARYLASAELLERCESDLGVVRISPELQQKRMRAYALSVQNFLKAGDITRARENYERFREEFPQRDLYFADGSSFVDTMSVLLGYRDDSRRGAMAKLNISRELRSELRRAHYWRRH